MYILMLYCDNDDDHIVITLIRLLYWWSFWCGSLAMTSCNTSNQLFWQVYTVDLESRMVEETRSRAQNAGFQNMEAGMGAADKDQVSADFSLETPWENYVDCVGILRIFWVSPNHPTARGNICHVFFPAKKKVSWLSPSEKWGSCRLELLQNPSPKDGRKKVWGRKDAATKKNRNPPRSFHYKMLAPDPFA